jgi:hypothetical protein
MFLLFLFLESIKNALQYLALDSIECSRFTGMCPNSVQMCGEGLAHQRITANL